MDPAQHWSAKLKTFLPAFLGQHPVLASYQERASVVLHGSTCRGVDDAFSDLDLYFILSAVDLVELDARSSTRFFEIQVDGKPGHLNAQALADFTARVDGCDLPLITELRSALPIEDRLDGVEELLASARRPMRDEVRRAFFFHHYVQMRSFHRTGDNSMERGDAVAVLFGVSQALAHALRAALVFDGEPYPYEKWLRRQAVRHPTGEVLAPHVEAMFDHIADDVLRRAGPEKENPLSQELHRIRHVLIDAARAGDIDEPWLHRWWLHIEQAEAATEGVRWADG